MAIDVSIAICTYNRAKSLALVLQSLSEQQNIDPGAVELLIVDNNSDDQTAEVVAAYAPKFPVRYIFEKQQGLSHARNRAAVEFFGNILLFTDDDVRLAPNWLHAYAKAFSGFSEMEYF